MRVDSVSAATLGTYVLNGEFNRQQHLGALAAAQLRASQWPDGMIDYTLLPGTDGRGR
jgi:hypothetical protein